VQFPGAPVAIMVLAGTMEAGKLVIVGWLAAHWLVAGWRLKTVLVTLVTGLALINAAGVFGKLVEAHVATAATARAGVSERTAVVDARLASQSSTIADLDHRISQIDAAVEEATRRGRTAGAMNLAERQRSTRDGLVGTRQAAKATLVEIQTQRAALTAEGARRGSSGAGPISRGHCRHGCRDGGAVADTLDGPVLRSGGNRIDDRRGGWPAFGAEPLWVGSWRRGFCPGFLKPGFQKTTRYPE
jgi:hypothetical protein